MKIDNWNLSCPKCGQDKELEIQIIFSEVLTPDLTIYGVLKPISQLLKDDTTCHCGDCGYQGKLKDYKMID